MVDSHLEPKQAQRPTRIAPETRARATRASGPPGSPTIPELQPEPGPRATSEGTSAPGTITALALGPSRSRVGGAHEPRRPNFASPHWLDLTNPLSVGRGYRCPKPGPGRTEQTREDQTRPWVAQTCFLWRPSPSHMAAASLLLRHGLGRRCSTYGSGSGSGSTASHLGHRCPNGPEVRILHHHLSHLTPHTSRRHPHASRVVLHPTLPLPSHHAFKCPYSLI